MPKRIIYTNKLEHFKEGDQLWANIVDSKELAQAKFIISKILDNNVCGLKDFQIEIIRMWIYGYTFREIGEKIRCSPECARRNYVRILKKMKKFFDQNPHKLMIEGFFGEYL